RVLTPPLGGCPFDPLPIPHRRRGPAVNANFGACFGHIPIRAQRTRSAPSPCFFLRGEGWGEGPHSLGRRRPSPLPSPRKRRGEGAPRLAARPPPPPLPPTPPRPQLPPPP